MKSVHISLLMAVVVMMGMMASSSIIYAQSSEQNEKQMECWDYKKSLMGDANAFLINCIEYANSNYDSVQEYLEEEHPELQFNNNK